jgi:2-methylcitrate dehydratase PrpD
MTVYNGMGTQQPTLMTMTESLTDIGLAPASADLPESAYEAAARLMLDALGCALAAANAPGMAAVAEQMQDWGGKPEATTLVFGNRVPGPNAVFTNSALVHALDYDDVYIPGILHITSIIVPVVLAAGEMSNASGRDTLAAMIMGIETAGRLGRAETPLRRGAGFLPSSLVGGFGAVTAAARLLGLSREQCVQAMGINYAQASGNRQALLDHTLTKRLQPAFAARSAMWAVALANRGITGPHRALDGEAGYFQCYMNGTLPSREALTEPREVLAVEHVAVKRFPSCGACHHAQFATERLMAEEALRPEDIDRVELFGCGPGGLVGHPFEPGDSPSVAAQFSVSWAVARTLLRGSPRLADYTDERVAGDTAVIQFARRITYVPVPEGLPPAPPVPLDYPPAHTRPQGVIVHTIDGRRLMRAQYPTETFGPGNATFEQTVEKFRDCARFGGCPVAREDVVIRLVKGLASAPDIHALIASLT